MKCLKALPRVFFTFLILAAPTACARSAPTATPLPTATRQPDVTVCASGCDFTTLQAAIDADDTAPGDIVQVVDAVHTEASITVNKNVVIRGRGADSTIVQAHAEPESASDRVFLVLYGASATIEGVTIRHGRPSECPMSGGGISNQGTLALENSVVTANTASAGGGILNQGTITLTNCTVSDNVADGHGGEHGAGRGSGGGIKNMMGAMTIVNSTISGNQCARYGGGIKVSCSATLVLINSTVSGNLAVANGGGLEVRGKLTSVNSTISHNTARSSGGGVYLQGTSDHVRGILVYTNTLIADNTPGDCLLGDEATIGANANNLVGDNSCDATFSGDPRLEGLADNGGACQTHALLPGSPAIDAVPAASCPLTLDQRGRPRPVAHDSSDTPCDIGAFELQPD